MILADTIKIQEINMLDEILNKSDVIRVHIYIPHTFVNERKDIDF